MIRELLMNILEAGYLFMVILAYDVYGMTGVGIAIGCGIAGSWFGLKLRDLV